jgi:hypothetical protein
MLHQEKSGNPAPNPLITKSAFANKMWQENISDEK